MAIDKVFDSSPRDSKLVNYFHSKYMYLCTHWSGKTIACHNLISSCQVYYVPVAPFYNHCVLPTVFTTLPLLRFIFLREKINVVHGHSVSSLYKDSSSCENPSTQDNIPPNRYAIYALLQSFSTLAHEAMFHARTMGIRAVFTDHSLFGFADASSIITNKVLKYSLAGTNHVICVSHTR